MKRILSLTLFFLFLFSCSQDKSIYKKFDKMVSEKNEARKKQSKAYEEEESQNND
jgi:hypothetical protein